MTMGWQRLGYATTQATGQNSAEKTVPSAFSLQKNTAEILPCLSLKIPLKAIK